MSDCTRPDLGQQLYRWVRGEVDDDARRSEIAAHLDTCARCGAVARELGAILGTMRLPGGPEYDAELAHGLDRILHGDATPSGLRPTPASTDPRSRPGWWSRWLRRLRS
jgi:anti-sigma factor RsiW